MGSFITSATGTGNSFAAAAAPIEKDQDFKQELGGSLNQFNQTFNNQNSLAQQLQAQALGQGPNPAQIQLQQATNRNIQQNAGYLSSQKGLSPALAARLSAQNAAQGGQQAAGQASLMGAQQQISAQQNLAGLYNNQSQGALGAYSTQQNALAGFNNAQVGITSNQNNVNAGVAGQNAATAKTAVGGLLGGAASSLFAKGGMVPQKYGYGGAVDMPNASSGPSVDKPEAKAPEKSGGLLSSIFAHGGMVPQNFGYGGAVDMPDSVRAGALNQPISDIGQYLNASGDHNDKDSSGNKSMYDGFQKLGQGKPETARPYTDTDSMIMNGSGAAQAMPAALDAGDAAASALPAAEAGAGSGAGMAGLAAMFAAKGGQVPSCYGGGVKRLAMGGDSGGGGGASSLMSLIPLALMALNKGGDPAGTVPGKAQVAGDSLKNDKVPAMLSPREIVIPRSITTHENAPALAAEFVRKELEKHGHASKKNYDSGGMIDSVKGWFGDNTQSQATAEGNKKNAQMADPRSIPPMYPGMGGGSKKVAHYDDGGSVLPAALDANAPETKLAPVDTSFDPGQALTPTPGQDYGSVYEKAYQQDRQMNPGYPEEWSRTHALTTAEQAKKADSMAQNFNNERQVSNMQSAHDSAIAENSRRQALGLSPVPIPEAPAQVALQQPQGNTQAMNQIPDMNQGPSGMNAMQAMDQSMLGGYQKAVGEQKAGYNLAAQTQGQLGEQNANIAHNEAMGQRQLMQDYQTKQQDYMDQYNKAMQDYSEGHINPDHYAESRGAVGKVKTAIGLILGGIGGGLMGTENPALKFMNMQIDRDMRAQEMDLGKKQNLLTANYHRLGNLRDATDMTRAMMMGFQASQFKEAAAKAQGPMAKAIALQEAGKLDERVAPIMSQIAMRQAMMKGQQMDPAMAINFMAPEGQKVELMKQLQTAQNMSKQKDNLMNAFEQANKIQTIAGRLTDPIQSGRKVEALIQPLLAQLIKDSEGRITPQDTAMMEGLFPKPGDTDATRMLKRNQLNKFVTEKMNFPGLKMYGFDPSRTGRFDANGMDRLPPMAPPKR